MTEVEILRTAVIDAAWDTLYVLPRILRAAGVEGPFEQQLISCQSPRVISDRAVLGYDNCRAGSDLRAIRVPPVAMGRRRHGNFGEAVSDPTRCWSCKYTDEPCGKCPEKTP